MQPNERPHTARRRVAFALVVGAVLLLHALATQGVMDHLRDKRQEQGSSIKRMEATLLDDMVLSDPPVVAAPAPAEQAVAPLEDEPPAAAPRAASKASQPASAASDPDDAVSAPQASASDSALASPAPAASSSDDQALAQAPALPLGSSAPDMQALGASAEPAPALAAASVASGPAAAFEWPLATRVTFKVEGHVRGPIYGNAKVEWIRQDMRYQVHVDAQIGPSFAPLGSQRWTSEGTITPQGLAPQRFESVNKLLIKTSTPRIVTFEDKEVVLANGTRVPRLPGVQDGASHYIQLAYQFLLNPSVLKAGASIDVPLVMNKSQDIIVYKVVGEEVLDTPLGKISTFHVKPTRLVSQPGDLLAEVWFAPSLQYLPIRMLFRQGPENFLDMRMDRAPRQTGGSAIVPPKTHGASSASPPRPPSLMEQMP